MTMRPLAACTPLDEMPARAPVARDTPDLVFTRRKPVKF
jgi:hypothetical protein